MKHCPRSVRLSKISWARPSVSERVPLMLYCACVKWTKAVRILTHELRMCHSIKRKSLLCELIADDGYMNTNEHFNHGTAGRQQQLTTGLRAEEAHSVVL